VGVPARHRHAIIGIMRERALSGRLLVATPVIGDPNFDRTVVFVLEHNEGGTLGLVLNRPSEVAVHGPLPAWDTLAAAPPVVFVGGPVEQGAAVVGLARRASDARPGAGPPGGHPSGESPGFSPVWGPIGTLDLSLDPGELPGVEEVRVFAGYASWGPGQLDEELAVDAWFVLEARADDVLSSDPDALWTRVLRRQGGDLALVSYCGPDPSRN
jgi:putative transcriptional regulator